MQVTTEHLENSKVNVHVVLDAAEVKEAVAKAYKSFSKKYRIPGFRAGKAPRKVIDSMFGKEAILADATNETLNSQEPFVLNEADITALGNPEYADIQPFVEGESYSYTITCSVRPSYELSSYDNVAIYLPDTEPAEADIDEQIERLRGYYASVEDIKRKRAVKAGDLVELSMVDEKDGMMNTEHVLYELGSGEMPDNFDESLVGMKIDEEKKFVVNFPYTTTEAQDEAEEGEQGELTEKQFEVPVAVTVHAIKVRVLPEVNDEFAKNSFGMESLQVMRDMLKQDIKSAREHEQESLKEQRVITKLSRRLSDELDERYVEIVMNDLGRQFFSQLAERNMTLDAYLHSNNLTPDQFMSDLKMQATDVARESLALDALARHLKFEVTEADIDEQFAMTQTEDIEASKREFLENGQLPSLRDYIRRMKAINWLMEGASVTVTADGIDPEEAALVEAANKEAEAAKKKAAKKPAAKKTTTKKPAAKKTTAKKAAEAEGEAEVEAKAEVEATEQDAPAAKEEVAEKKPARKKPAAKKPATKKAADAPAADDDARA